MNFFKGNIKRGSLQFANWKNNLCFLVWCLPLAQVPTYVPQLKRLACVKGIVSVTFNGISQKKKGSKSSLSCFTTLLAMRMQDGRAGHTLTLSLSLFLLWLYESLLSIYFLDSVVNMFLAVCCKLYMQQWGRNPDKQKLE